MRRFWLPVEVHTFPGSAELSTTAAWEAQKRFCGVAVAPPPRHWQGRTHLPLAPCGVTAVAVATLDEVWVFEGPLTPEATLHFNTGGLRLRGGTHLSDPQVQDKLRRLDAAALCGGTAEAIRRFLGEGADNTRPTIHEWPQAEAVRRVKLLHGRRVPEQAGRDFVVCTAERDSLWVRRILLMLERVRTGGVINRSVERCEKRDANACPFWLC